MQIETQDFLSLTERAGTIAFLDTESTGLHGDYNSLLVGSVKPIGKTPYSFWVAKPGLDKGMVRVLRDDLEKYDLIVTFYGQYHDWPLINTRLLRWGFPALARKHHLDLYWVIRNTTKMSRRNQAHILSWLKADQQKMSVSAEDWNEVLHNPRAMKTMIKRCESDVEGVQALYTRIKPYIKNINRMG